MSNQKPNTEGTCKQCGEAFWYIYRANRPHPYCSFECFSKSKSTKVPSPPGSGSGYVEGTDGQWWYFWGKGKYHQRAYRRTCEVCGKAFFKRGKQAYQSGKERFCSKTCSATWMHRAGLTPATQAGEASTQWRGGHENYRGPSWPRQRRAARGRDNYTCQDCGITEEDSSRRMEVHHIIPFGRFGVAHHEEANTLSNLISLCWRCHRQRDGVRDTLFR